MRWAVRLLGVISIAVLARLLDKTDFGLVAMATAVVALPQVLLNMGVEQAVIRERTPSADTYNTAWTIRFAQMSIVSFIIFSTSPWIAEFYGDERIIEILRILSLSIFIQGMENIWVVAFLKTYKFRKDFYYNTFLKIASVAVTVALAFWLRSYWALVYGQVAAATLRLGLSFAMAPEMARPTLRQWRQIWSFSQWSLIRGLAQYVVSHGDRLLLGRLVGAEPVGLYTVGREIGEMPVSEISAPVNRVLGPGFSSLQAEPKRLVAAISKSIGAVATAVFPMAIGLALTAEYLVPLALGSGWSGVVPILQLLALGGFFSGIRGVMGNTLVVIGYIRTSTFIAWFRAFLLLALGVPAAVFAGAVGLAGAFLAMEIIALGTSLYFYRRHLPQLALSSLVASTARPAAAVAVMAPAVIAVVFSGISHPALLLLAQVAIGASVYTIVLFGLWHAMGRPDSVERIVLERFVLLKGFLRGTLK